MHRMKIDPKMQVVGAVLILTVIASVAYGAYRYWLTSEALTRSNQEVSALEQALSKLQEEYATLLDAFTAEKARNDAFADQINDISGTVGKLDKLSRTDPELLQKYSKVYFLNENYAPEAYEKIPSEFVFGEDDEYMSAQVWPFLKDLLEDAKDESIDLKVISGFRSFQTQAALKASYRVTYGSGANTFSADQGYSEHQLGSAVDFTTTSVGASFVGFDQSEAFTWLSENAYKYGFILSYPHNNTYYQYEPWHWRFVGRELARHLHKEGLDFYDLDQRTIDTYLINLFD